MFRFGFQCPICNHEWELDAATEPSPECPSCGLAGQEAKHCQPLESPPVVHLDMGRMIQEGTIDTDVVRLWKLTEDQRTVLDRILEQLNTGVTADPAAMSLLAGVRIPCNQDLAAHDTIHVWAPPKMPLTVGLLGVLNAVVDAAIGNYAAERGGSPLLAAEWDVATQRITKFVLFNPNTADFTLEPGKTLI